MATPRPYKFYPPEYTTLLLNALKTPIVVPCGDKAAARRLRGQLYAFRSSLAIPNCGAPPELVLVSPLIAFKLDDCNLIVLRPNRTTTLAKALAHVKNNGGSTSAPNTPDEVGVPESVRQHDVDNS